MSSQAIAVSEPVTGTRITFLHPEGDKPAIPVRPVFLPYAGCPSRCLYCAQEIQTGLSPVSLPEAIGNLRRDLEAAAARGDAPFELGFYGGTFTLLPGDFASRFVALACEFKSRGLVARVRCSTRPDAVDVKLLDALRGIGLDMVELGVQSFDEAVLAASRRGYTGETAGNACRTVAESGLALGIQLLPGLPGHTPELFRRDIGQVLALAPECLRLYPCLVVSGSDLAGAYARGEYLPWTLEMAVSEIARALPAVWRAGVKIARIGLAPQPELLDRTTAGPWHPAFGAMARSRALLSMIEERLGGLRLVGIGVPRRYQGEFFGHGGALAASYARLGLARERVRFCDEAQFALEVA